MFSHSLSLPQPTCFPNDAHLVNKVLCRFRIISGFVLKIYDVTRKSVKYEANQTRWESLLTFSCCWKKSQGVPLHPFCNNESGPGKEKGNSLYFLFLTNDHTRRNRCEIRKQLSAHWKTLVDTTEINRFLGTTSLVLMKIYEKVMNIFVCICILV